MNHFGTSIKLLLIGTVATAGMAPSQAHADWFGRLTHRQDMKDQWRNLAYLGAGVAVLGLASHNNYLVGAGVAGGLYSVWRLGEDGHSHDPEARRRFAFYNRTQVIDHGVTYHRVEVNQHGQRFYAFKRGPMPAPARKQTAHR